MPHRSHTGAFAAPAAPSLLTLHVHAATTPLIHRRGVTPLARPTRAARVHRAAPRACTTPAPTARAPRIIISGAPASGKGTQCAELVAAFGVVHLSTGDMLRAEVAAGSALGARAAEYMNAGALVPDALIIDLVVARVQRDDCAARGWLLDGFPRTAAQARALDDAGVAPDVVLALDVPEDLLVRRVVGRRLDPDTGDIYHVEFAPPPEAVAARLVQRSDDTEEKARARLVVFGEHSAAVEAHYAPLLRRVDGDREKGAIAGDLAQLVRDAVSDGDDDDAPGAPPSASAPASAAVGDAASENKTGGMPVAEFVRRAEEAYERGSLENADVNWSGQARASRADEDGTRGYGDVLQRPVVAAGDAAALFAFAAVGHLSHAHGEPLDVTAVAQTAAPFLLGWFAVAPLLGGYTRVATANVTESVKSALGPAVAAVAVGLVLRSVAVHHAPPIPFVGVSTVSVCAFMAIWRTAYASVRGDETETIRRGGLADGFSMVTTLLRRW